MNRIRTRLIAAFLLATIAPLVATAWMATSLLKRSLDYAATEQLDTLSKSLQEMGREYYQQAQEVLRARVKTGGVPHREFLTGHGEWPEDVAAFWESGDAERFAISGNGGDHLDYLVRQDNSVWEYTAPLGNVHMEQLSGEYRGARQLVQFAAARDLRRGFTVTLIILMAAVWVVSFALLVYVANRMSQPIEALTAGLSELASGHLQTRIDVKRNDEIGRAINAFNHTAGQLQQSRDRLVYLTQIASWQSLARKMAHELKNSLTPIRLTVEEILARQPEGGRQFIGEAVQIVVNEVESLERRVRAFSEFSSDTPLRLTEVDTRALLQDRIGFLKPGHPEMTYDLEIESGIPPAFADVDRVRGILTNLLENAAEAAGPQGRVLARSYTSGDMVCLEVHDSGPGLSEESQKTLFEPTISFKTGGMGLGLSIARKDALVCGGDLLRIDGKLGGAGFRLTLPQLSRGSLLPPPAPS
jgi:nitrogen fixation/metabolism regulation signal transduction histidine kinase